MGVRAYYLAVPPNVAERAERDEALWAELSFEPPAHYPSCEIEKSWSTLWHLLDPAARGTGPEPEPSTDAGRAVMGAHVFGRAFAEGDRYPQDLAGVRGHPRLLRPFEVVRASAALSTVTAPILLAAYDAGQIERGVYSVASEDVAWSYFERLRDFYEGAAERGDVVLVHIW